MQLKFGQNIPEVGSQVLMLNNRDISRYSIKYVRNILLTQDISHIQYSNPHDATATDLIPIMNTLHGQSLDTPGDRRMLVARPSLMQLNANAANHDVPIVTNELQQHANFLLPVEPPETRGNYDFNIVFPEPSRQRARGDSIYFKALHLSWDLRKPCVYCGCVMFFSDDDAAARKKCCDNGRIFTPGHAYPHLKPLPAVLLKYCMQFKNHMGRNSVSYNNVLSLGVCGIENESGHGGFETIHGDHSLLLHGRMYHFLPNNTRTGGLYFFTYDAMQEMQNYGDRSMNQRDENGEIKHYRFYPNIGGALYDEQKQINYLVQECVAQGERVRQEIMPVINLTTTTFDIASIVSEDANRPNRRIFYQLRDQRNSSSINLMSNIMEPLCYPLLFPFGEKGRGGDNRKAIKFNDYILHRFLLPERNSDGELLLMPTQSSPPELVPFSRFQVMFRLGQTYLVDMLSRSIDYRLQFNKFSQHTLFGQTRPESQDIENGENLEPEGDDGEETKGDDNTEKKTFLSQSFHGSRRHLLSLAQNAICLVTEYGRPTLFITFTCNPNWPEIKEMLFEGETAFDRADVTDMVFHAKLERFLHNLRNGKYFGQRHMCRSYSSNTVRL